MKPHHLPFKVMKKWPELLEAYSKADPLAEIPVLYLKRNAKLHLGVEEQIRDPLTIKLLFYEMSFKVVYSLYPTTLDEAAYLSAIQLRLQVGFKAKKSDIKFGNDAMARSSDVG